MNIGEYYFFIDSRNDCYIIYYGLLTNKIPKYDPRLSTNVDCEYYMVFKCNQYFNDTIITRRISSMTIQAFKDINECVNAALKQNCAIFYDSSVMNVLKNN